MIYSAVSVEKNEEPIIAPEVTVYTAQNLRPVSHNYRDTYFFRPRCVSSPLISFPSRRSRIARNKSTVSTSALALGSRGIQKEEQKIHTSDVEGLPSAFT